MDPRPRPLADLLAGLPPEPAESVLWPDLKAAVRQGARPLVAIDDDPTGVQTVHDTRVLLTWGEAELAAEIAQPAPLFFVLTNSRSLPTPDAKRINVEIGRRLVSGSRGPFVVASRSDSTLRGHYPAEVQALEEGLGQRFDGHLLVPAFFEGGRYTVQDTHWVATPVATSSEVIPASATSFAQDAVFGYRTAYLPEWVEEKSRGRWRAGDVQSVSLQTVREGPDAVCRRLMAVDGGVPVVVNVAGYGDLTAFVLGLLRAEAEGKQFLYRTAASFVRVRAGLSARPDLSPSEVYAACRADGASDRPGLVVVGSYQPSSTTQIERLLAASHLRPRPVEMHVQTVLEGRWAPERAGAEMDAALEAGDLPVLYTSRRLVTGTGEQNLAIGRQVTDALLSALQHLQVRPRFVIAKGGITSHEVAQRGLGATRALVLGQLQPGVPVWRLAGGPGLRFADMPYVVFPGNVGGPDSLLAAAETLTAP